MDFNFFSFKSVCPSWRAAGCTNTALHSAEIWLSRGPKQSHWFVESALNSSWNSKGEVLLLCQIAALQNAPLIISYTTLIGCIWFLIHREEWGHQRKSSADPAVMFRLSDRSRMHIRGYLKSSERDKNEGLKIKNTDTDTRTEQYTAHISSTCQNTHVVYICALSVSSFAIMAIVFYLSSYTVVLNSCDRASQHLINVLQIWPGLLEWYTWTNIHLVFLGNKQRI